MTNEDVQISIEQIRNQISNALYLSGVITDRVKMLAKGTKSLPDNAADLADLLLEIVLKISGRLNFSYSRELIEIEGNLAEVKTGVNIEQKQIAHLKTKVSNTVRILRKLHPIMKYISGSIAENNPWEVINHVDKLCRSINPEIRVIIGPKWDYEYKATFIANEFYSILLDSSDDQTDENDEIMGVDEELRNSFRELLRASNCFYLISFPSTGTDDFLQMTQWGHEIGHIVNQYNILQNYLNSMSETQNSVSDDDKGEDSSAAEESSADVVESCLREEGFYEKLDNMHELRKKKIIEIAKKYKGKTTQLPKVRIEIKEDKEINELENRISIYYDLEDRLMNWGKEFFADIFSIYLLGFASFLGLAEYFNIYGNTAKNKNNNSTSHPSDVDRLFVMDYVLSKWIEPYGQLKRDNARVDEFSIIKDEIKKFRSIYKLRDWKDGFRYSPHDNKFMVNMIEKIHATIISLVRKNSDCFLSPRDIPIAYRGIQDIECQLPVEFSLREDLSRIEKISDLKYLTEGEITIAQLLDWAPSLGNKFFALTINTGWMTLLKRKNSWRKGKDVLLEENNGKTNNDQYDGFSEIYEEMNLLLIKSIQNSEAIRWFFTRIPYGNAELRGDFERNSRKENQSNKFPSGVLGQEELKKKISSGDITIRPLLDIYSQVGTSSIDLRLGNEFILSREPEMSGFDFQDYQSLDASIKNPDDGIYKPFGKPFVLYPGRFVLASTLEYIKIPSYLTGELKNRASLSRKGLSITKGFKITPEFCGCITLELENTGETPINLYPGSRIGQISLSTLKTV
jgi:dCTP deaminase